MTFQFSTSARNGALDAIEVAAGASAILRLRTGAPPANCAAVRSGTVLATMALPADYMSAAAGGVKSLLGSWQDASADASGEAGMFEIVDNAGSTCHVQGLCSAPWQAAKAYVIGSTVHSSGNVYRATSAGTSSGTGPSHTSGSAVDGGVTWLFVQAGTDMTVDNGTLVAGQVVNGIAFTITAGGA
jgi:hypothetical protein